MSLTATKCVRSPGWNRTVVCSCVAACALGTASGQVFTHHAAFRATAGLPARMVTADDVPHNTQLFNQYPGIEFNGTVRSWDAISFGGGGTAVSPRNVLFNYGSEPMRWRFSPPARSMGVFNPSIFDRIRLRLLRSDGTAITTIDMDTTVVTFAGYVSTEDIVAVEAAGIAGASNFTIFLDDLEWSDGCPRIQSSPRSINACTNETGSAAVAATGVGPLRNAWWVIDPDAPGGRRPVLEGVNPAPRCVPGGELFVIGADQPTVSVFVVGGVGFCEPEMWTSVVSNSCGEVESEPFTVEFVPCLGCPADFNQDGGIDGADVDAFFGAWEAGDFAADVNGDGGVDGADVDTFFNAWEAGGCG